MRHYRVRVRSGGAAAGGLALRQDFEATLPGKYWTSWGARYVAWRWRRITPRFSSDRIVYTEIYDVRREPASWTP